MTTHEDKLAELMTTLSHLEALRPFASGIKYGEVFSEVWDVLLEDAKEQAAVYRDLRLDLRE